MSARLDRASIWLGDAWLCPDCGKVLRRPPWLYEGDRLHSGGCPSAMVRVTITLPSPRVGDNPVEHREDETKRCGNCGEPYPGRHLFEGLGGAQSITCPKHTAAGTTSFVHDGFIAQCDICAVFAESTPKGDEKQ